MALIRYYKLFDMLARRGYKKTDLICEVGLSSATVYCQALADKIGVMISTLSAFCVPTAFPTSEICQA